MLAICLALINDDEDKKSFEQLVKKFEKKLYTESFKILRSHELAEEAVYKYLRKAEQILFEKLRGDISE